ncbi:hypothetical protein FHQ28_08610 [Pasteurellaceae bacterium USgator11]|nr:hypothetical protein FHQ20_11655 [Pasteurellaceae bacterium USgator41]TNG98683.1 hypothetical protein FHQ24_07820 [Pasteurellaceae bacterium UScroc31]TNH00050.1 hypothetical protein FHQ28_08610 [Pasteurellaceae bacterium USgator11]
MTKPKKPTITLDEMTTEIASVITGFELVQDFVLDGDVEQAKLIYKQTLEQAKRFGWRLAASAVEPCYVQCFDPNC